MYSNLLEELRDIKNSIMIKKFFMLLDLSTDISMYDDIIDKAQNGYCEDLAIYFYFKYNDIDFKILNINSRHHIIMYNDLYYDSKAREGVEKISLIPYFYLEKIETVTEWSVSEIPEYYHEKWKILSGEINTGENKG